MATQVIYFEMPFVARSDEYIAAVDAMERDLPGVAVDSGDDAITRGAYTYPHIVQKVQSAKAEKIESVRQYVEARSADGWRVIRVEG